MKKICAILLVASLLMVGLTNEVNAENRKMLSDAADRYTPGGPTPCYHCVGDGRGHQVPPEYDMESNSGAKVISDHD